MTRRKFFALAAAAAATTTLGGVALARKAQRELVVTRHRRVLPGVDDLRLVHLTDLHVGWSTPARRLAEVVEEAARAQPDLVLLTGDYLNHTLEHMDELRRVIRALPRPCVATLGNHDHWSGAEAIAEMLQAEGVIVLCNEHRRIPLPGGRHLTIVGVDDAFTDHDDIEAAFNGVEEPEKTLTLTHHPNSADEIIAHGSPLVLAGHTHGGQVDVPFVTKALSRTVGTRYLAGWYSITTDDGEEGHLFVNAGIGSSATPVRVGTRAAPELAIIDISSTGSV